MTEQLKEVGRKPRKRSPRPHNNGRCPGLGEYLRQKWQDPEWRAAIMEKRKAAGLERKQKRNFRQGIPDGMRKAEAEALWAQAAVVADRFIKLMEDTGELPVVPTSEEEMAKSALREACTYAFSPLTDAKTKQSYLSLILNFTKAKPETKSKITLDKSEEWLAAVAEDMKSDGRDGA